MVPIAREIRQDLFYLRHHIALSRESHLVPYLWMNDISRPAEVRDNGYGASGERFENYACAVVANGWKQHHVSGSQAPEDFRMADPPAERNSLLDPKGSHELLKAVPLWAITDHRKAGQIAAQKGSRRAQSKITSLPGNQPTNENQLKFGVGPRTARVIRTQAASDTRLRNKKQFTAICGELGIRLGRSGYDRCRMAIGGASERQISIQIPKVCHPFLLVVELAKTGRPGQTTI